MPRRKDTKMLDNPVERRRLARENVRSSAPKDEDVDPREVLSTWSREMRVLVRNARINIPLRDPIEVRRHLALIEDVIHNLRVQLVQRGSDESLLILARGTLRTLNQRINAYRKPAQD